MRQKQFGENTSCWYSHANENRMSACCMPQTALRGAMEKDT
jgi:hypothetical protein